MKYYYLEVVKGIDQGKVFALPDGTLTIGRNNDSTICINIAERSVSSRHAILYKSPELLLLQDMESTNGTYVDDARIKEQVISESTIIGLGKNGPRLKIIASDSPLEHYTKNNTQQQPYNQVITQNEVRKRNTIPDNSTSAQSVFFQTSSQQTPKSFFPEPQSVTLEMERKLIHNQMDVKDLHKLMKDGKRIEKIVDRGKINHSQSSLLVSAYGAGKKMRHRLTLVIGIISVLSLSIISILGLRMLHYKKILEKGLSLEQNLDTFEKAIFKANQNPEQNRAELDSLIRIFDKTNTQLSSVKRNLKSNDYERFYTDDTERDIDQIMKRFGEANYHIPPTMIERVKYHLKIYSGDLKPMINRYIQRKAVYYDMIRKTFSSQNLPEELGYIAMLESGYNSFALSHAGARGMWQFMPATARQYGLRVDNSVDQRCDPQLATKAAAEYFKDLIGIFGGRSSVMLVMAAYNAGEGRILRALRKIEDPMKNRDFWYIYRMGYLAEETNEYIPRVLALMIIDQHLSKYNFTSTKLDTLNLEKEDDFVEVKRIN